MNLEDKMKYMKRALTLAALGEGFVNPNPLVGAVIVKNGKIIGEGYHEKYGGAHAEVNAINNATEDVAGATMFVTLEPCSHYGNTPPCSLLIIEKKIKKVIIAKLDPNPLVYKNGVKMLEEAGVIVEYGLLEDEATSINNIFFYYITTKRPYVSVKYAMTLDGKIATRSFDSKWITNELAREHVHSLRNKYSAILVGVNTIIKDDAKLNTRRAVKSRNPVRIIIDPNLETPLTSCVVKTAHQQPTWIVSTRYSNKYTDLGVRIIQMKEINLDDLLVILGSEKIDSILIEGGSYTHGTFIDQKLVNKVYAYIAPKIVGGLDSLSPISGVGVNLMSEAHLLENVKITSFDSNLLIEGEFNKGVL